MEVGRNQAGQGFPGPCGMGVGHPDCRELGRGRDRMREKSL